MPADALSTIQTYVSECSHIFWPKPPLLICTPNSDLGLTDQPKGEENETG